MEQGSSVHEFNQRIIADQSDQVPSGISLGNAKDVCIGDSQCGCKQNAIHATVGNNRDCFPMVTGVKLICCIDHTGLHLHKALAIWKLCLRRMFHPLAINLRIFLSDVVIGLTFKIAEVNFAELLFCLNRTV